MQEVPYVTLGQIAQSAGCPTWCVRRLYERRLLPPARRVGALRVVRRDEVPQVIEALRRAGYLREAVAK